MSGSSSADAATLAYAKEHKLYELVDQLITEVAAARPENPVSFMGAIMQRRIAAREAAKGAAGDAALVSALPMHPQIKRTNVFPVREAEAAKGLGQDAARSGKDTTKPLRDQCLAQFGIWVHIRYADVPSVIACFEHLLFTQSLVTPPDITQNMEFLIQMLATASAVAHYKGFCEAAKLLPTRAVRLTPQVCEVLTEAILMSAPNATTSQRNDFVNFMQHITRVATGTSAAEDAAVISAVCAQLQSNEALWGQFLTAAQKSLVQLDPVMAVYGHSFSFFVQRLLLLAQGIINDSQGFQLYEEGDALKRRAQTLYRTAMRKSEVEVLPDRYAVFAAVFLRSLQHSLDEKHLTPTATQRLGNILGYVMEMINVIAGEAYGERRCVRHSNMTILRGCLRFLNYNYGRVAFSAGALAGFENAHNQRADSFLRDVAAPLGGYSDEMATSFIKVATLVVAAQRGGAGGDVSGGAVGSGTVLRAEPLRVRCYHQAYRSLLQALTAVVQLRSTLTAKQVLTTLARTFCFGAPPGNLHVHFLGAFSHVASVPDGETSGTAATTVQEREQAKAMLGILQAVCLLALRSPVMHDVTLSLPLIAEHAEVRRALSETLDASFPQRDLPPNTLCAFLEAHGVMSRLLSCYTASSLEAGVEQYFNQATTLAARLRLCRVYTSEDSFNTWAASPESAPADFRQLPPPSCEFLSMAMLAAAEPAERTMAPSQVAPALEVIAGLGPVILSATPTRATAQDRALLYTHFRRNGTSVRVFMRAVEDMLRTFPQYGPRLLHTSFSYETIQQSFHQLLMSLLRVPDDEAEASAALTALLKPVAVGLAVAGLRPRDYDLFGLSLCRAMRGAAGFPECEWVAFYLEMVDRLVSLVPPLRPLADFSSAEDVQRVVVVQRAVRRRLARRETSSYRGSALHRLQRHLALPSAATSSVESQQQQQQPSGAPGGSGTVEVGAACLDARAAQSIQLSWEALGAEGQVLATYHAVASLTVGAAAGVGAEPDAFSTDASFSLLERSRTIANHFSIVIAALTPRGKTTAATANTNVMDAPWKYVVQELFGGTPESFFDNCVPAECVRAFGQQLVSNVCDKIGLKHPNLRIAWITFVGALGALLMKPE